MRDWQNSMEYSNIHDDGEKYFVKYSLVPQNILWSKIYYIKLPHLFVLFTNIHCMLSIMTRMIIVRS